MADRHLVVRVRRVLTILIAFSMLFAPAITAGAFAAAPDGMQMMDQTGHCQMQPGDPADHHTSDGKSCCIWMCVAVTAGTAAPLSDDDAQRSAAVSAIASFHVGYLGEIATPPPRRA